MTTTLLDTSAVLAQQHIDELRQQGAHERLVRKARQSRRQRRSRRALGGWVHVATTR